MTNPELLRGHGLPRFEAIDASQVEAHIPALIQGLRRTAQLAGIHASTTPL